MTKEDAKAAYAALMKFYPLTVESLDSEEWKDIAGYDGKYQISNFGRVKSFCKRGISICKPFFNKGYLRTTLFKDNKAKKILIHRLVAEIFIPNTDTKPQVNHIDGCKLNNHVSNLEWVTRQENAQHSVKMGLQKIIQGEDKIDAKLTNTQAEYIRENPECLSQRKLAELFGVTRQTIGNIQSGKRYLNAGGKIRQAKPQRPRLPDDIRNEIRHIFKNRDSQFGAVALGRKFGCTATTILRIVKEGDDNN